MNNETNALNWFEIPVTDMARARHFYQVVFSIHMENMDTGNMEMATFPYIAGSGRVAGALVKSDSHKPSMEGTLVYLNANPDMTPVLERIETEGGRILLGKTLIDAEIGYMAFFEDTEGNKVGLHSQQ